MERAEELAAIRQGECTFFYIVRDAAFMAGGCRVHAGDRDSDTVCSMDGTWEHSGKTYCYLYIIGPKEKRCALMQDIIDGLKEEIERLDKGLPYMNNVKATAKAVPEGGLIYEKEK